MRKINFPIITEKEEKLPYYVAGVGYDHEQNHIIKPNGHMQYQWIQCT